MPLELLVLPVPIDPTSAPDAPALATDLERCCFCDPHLQRACFREFEQSDGVPLGLSWNGLLRFVIHSRDQLVRFGNALLRAFATQEIEIRVEFGDRKACVRTKNANFSEVMAILEELLGILP